LLFGHFLHAQWDISFQRAVCVAHHASAAAAAAALFAGMMGMMGPMGMMGQGGNMGQAGGANMSQGQAGGNLGQVNTQGWQPGRTYTAAAHRAVRHSRLLPMLVLLS
jgi:hypothetical protein